MIASTMRTPMPARPWIRSCQREGASSSSPTWRGSDCMGDHVNSGGRRRQEFFRAGHQLVELHGLREVLVGAEAFGVHLVALALVAGDHDDERLLVAGLL